MSAFLQQLPALIGVVIGALGSYLAVSLGDRARYRRETAAAWRDRRLTTYSEFARSVKTTVSVAFRVAAHLGNDPNPHPLTPDKAVEQLAAATEPRDIAWEAMLLLGAPAVVQASRAWFGTVAEMERFVLDRSHDPARWSALLDEQRDARARFYEAARRDLELPPGTLGRRLADPDPATADAT